MFELGSTMKIFRPYPEIFAFYDGRMPGLRVHGPQGNWLDDGAFSLGTCSYAIVDGDEALVYDPQMSLAHARIIRRTLEDAGFTRLRLVLSHWHTDHVAGNEVFADCEIIANSRTLKALEQNRDKLEAGDPPIRPLILPNHVFEEHLSLTIGSLDVELRLVDIHSHDESVLLFPKRDLLLAGDTLEDSVTYVSEPEHLATHLVELDRMAEFPFSRILPNHGDPDIIAGSGYDRRLIAATHAYVSRLLRLPSEPDLRRESLQDFGAASFATGGTRYFEPYEKVHRHNVTAVLKAHGIPT
jgi:glyoxylase-like metal-dependent hydrolase (beta-lactamase superfamily II)